MLYRQLGRSSLKVSALSVGGLHFGVFCDQQATQSILQRAFDLGINFIDTAPMYGSARSEGFIKEAIRGRRHELIIGTKVGLNPAFAPDGTFGVEVVALNKQNIRTSLEKSLRALGTDYIDLFQVHAFDPVTPLEETFSTLDALVREGKVRFIGCSNYDDKELVQAAQALHRQKSADFASLQCHYNLIERRAEQEIVPVCLENDYGLIVYRALCRGILTGKYKKDQPLPEGSRAQVSYRVKRWLTPETLSLTQALGKFAQMHNRTLTELSIAWLLKRPAVATVLAGMRNIEQLEICAQGVDWQLSTNELAEIDRIIDGLGLTGQVNSLPDTFLEK